MFFWGRTSWDGTFFVKQCYRVSLYVKILPTHTQHHSRHTAMVLFSHQQQRGSLCLETGASQASSVAFRLQTYAHFPLDEIGTYPKVTYHGSTLPSHERPVRMLPLMSMPCYLCYVSISPNSHSSLAISWGRFTGTAALQGREC